MEEVTIREHKGSYIFAIIFFGTLFAVPLSLIFYVERGVSQWYFWVLFSFMIICSLAVVGFFVASLIWTKTIISEKSLTTVFFNKKKTIFKEDILLIADVHMSRSHHYVIYPKSYDKDMIEKHKSVYLTPVERANMIIKDDRLLFIPKTKEITELFQRFQYIPTLIID